MSNSALTGNVLGLATTTSPGLVSTGAQTLAGKKTFDGGAAIKGDTSGSAIAAGYLGELTGTLRSGTNGFTYSTRSTTTVPATTASSVLSVSLNKGIYIISYKIRCASSTTSNLDAALYVGGTQVEATNSQGTATSTQFASATNSLPIVISSDGTTVAVFARLDTGISSGNSHEMWAIRIA